MMSPLTKASLAGLGLVACITTFLCLKFIPARHLASQIKPGMDMAQVRAITGKKPDGITGQGESTYAIGTGGVSLAPPSSFISNAYIYNCGLGQVLVWVDSRDHVEAVSTR